MPSSVSNALAVRAVQTLEEADALASDWVKLWERCPQATVFQRPEWILAAWRHLAPGVPRLLLVARSGQGIVALLPLRQNDPNEFTLEGAEVSDYLDALIDPAWQPLGSNLLLETIATGASARRLRLERLEATSPLMIQFPSRWTACLEDQDVCPFVPIPTQAKQLSAVIPRDFLRQVQRGRKQLERRFRVELHSAGPSEVGPMLERLFALHASRWNARGQPGVLLEPSILAFHREVVPQLLHKGRAWLFELRLSDQPAAALLTYCFRRRAMAYIGGFAPEFESFSPGRALLAETFERALREDCYEVDFLRGVERYKYDWGARNRSTHRLVLQTRGELRPERDSSSDLT